MPDGSVVDVAFAPVIAAVSLGGPAVAAWVGLLGTTQGRRTAPTGALVWGVANHLRHCGASVLSALALQAIPSRSLPVVDFAATTAAATIYFSLNVLITSTIISFGMASSVAKLLRSVGGGTLPCSHWRQWRG